MKLALKIIALSISALVVGVLIYFNTNSYMSKQEWKYGGGKGHIGDFIDFTDGYYKIKGKKIYWSEEHRGTIVFCFGKGLIITSKETGDFSEYEKKPSGFSF